MINSTGNEIVDKMMQFGPSGNIIPNTWYKSIRYENGKPNLIAITLLSDIVYWYRPQEKRDERTGATVGFYKKFQSDLLQRSYTDLENHFGLTRKQLVEAFKLLEALGVAKRVFRNLDIGGMKVSNVMFIELDPDRLKELTFGEEADENNGITDGIGVSTLKETPLDIEVDTSIPIEETPLNSKVETNTKNTTENTTKISIYPILADKNERLYVLGEYPDMKEVIDGIFNIIEEVVNTSDDVSIKVNGQPMPAYMVKSRYSKLTSIHICDVIEGVRNSYQKVKNMRAYLITSLFNAPSTSDISMMNWVSSNQAEWANREQF